MTAAANTYDSRRKPEGRSVRRLSRLVGEAFVLVWRSGSRELQLAIALQAIWAVGVVVQLLVGRQVLEALINADRLDGGAGTLLPSLLVLLVVSAVMTFSGAARIDLQSLLAELTARHAQDRILDVATTVDLEAFEDPKFHDCLQRAQAGASSRSWAMTSNLVTLLGATIGVVGLAVALAALQPLLLPAVLLAYAPAWLAAACNSRMAHRFGWQMTQNDRQRHSFSYALSDKTHAAEIRAYQLSNFLRGQYDELYDERIGELRSVVQKRVRHSLRASVATSLLLAGAIALLVALLMVDRISIAGAAAAAVAIQQLNGRLVIIGYNATGLYESALFLEDFMAFLALVPVAAETPSVPAPEGFHSLTLDHVSFSYPGSERLVLDDVSLKIQGGEVIALVGENGSGKTTLAKLLCNLYTPTAGQILWDGVDISGCNPAQVGRYVAVLFQDFVQYFLSAQHNVGVGDHSRVNDLEAVVAAAMVSGAHSFLSDLPEGYETLLGRQFEGGQELSIGQWQRVAIARAFFRSSPLLILDEPTAALDPRAEHELFERLRALASRRTVLLISHRFSSVRSADRIYVLRRGRVIEGGSHDQLMVADGLYAELFRLQAAAYNVPASPSASDRS